MKRFILHIVIILASIGSLQAQDVVFWKFELADKGNGEIELVAKANIEAGWHLYDVDIPENGPNPTSLSIDELKGATKVGAFKPVNSKLHKEYDPLFEMQIGYYEDQATFVQRFKVTDKNTFSLKGDVRAQACNDETCTPPLPIDFEFSAKDLPKTLTVAAQ